MRRSLTAIFLYVLCCIGPALASDFRAGAGKSDIKTSATMWPVQGFTSQHDPLAVRVLLLNDTGSQVALVVIDLTSLSEMTITRTKATVTSNTGILPKDILVVASHTFSAPHVGGGPPPSSGGAAGRANAPAGSNSGAPGGDNQGPRNGGGQDPGAAAFSNAIDAAVQEAAMQAKTSMQPARVGFGTGASDVNVNRDVPTAKGWWLGADASGFSDKSLPVIRIDRLDGKPLAILINEAVQSSVMDHSKNLDGTTPVTSDVAGAATRFVEKQFGDGVVAFFLIGAAGDQAPSYQGNRYVLNHDGSTERVDIHDAGFTLVDLLGERLGIDAMQTADGIKATANPTLQLLRRSIEVSSQSGSHGLPTGPVLSYDYQPGPKVQVPVVLLRIGDIAIVGLRVEIAASVGVQIKAASPFPHTMVVTMVEGAAKYMPDERSYDRFSYEARNSSYARGSAEAVASSIDELLAAMKKAPATP